MPISGLTRLAFSLMSEFIGAFFRNRGMALAGVAKTGQFQLLQPFVTLAARIVLLGKDVALAVVAIADRQATARGKVKRRMSGDKPRKSFGRRADYRHFLPITTRWMDNDLYGHINNVVYYSFFDTVVNRFLIEGGVLDLEAGEVIGLVVETGCRYAKPLAFPEPVTAGLRVAHMGRSSVRYEVALFRGNDDDAVAEGHFIHVYVERASRRPTPLPGALRALLGTVAAGSGEHG